MAESRNIFFVTWPDGKVDSHSLNVFSADHAKKWLIQEWLPEHIFGKTSWLDGMVLQRIWQGMVEKGFKIHELKVGEDGKPILADNA
jgi:hypothetical protein